MTTRGNRVRSMSAMVSVGALVLAGLIAGTAPAQAQQATALPKPPAPLPVAISVAVTGSTAKVTYSIDASAKDIRTRDCTLDGVVASCGTVVTSTRRSTSFAVTYPGLVGHTHLFRIRATLDDRRTASGSAAITGVNNPPKAVADGYSVNQDTVLTVSTVAQGVLNNDSDPDLDALSAKVITGPANGKLTLNANGTFTYTPVPGFVGTDTFTYVANDGLADSAAATVTITLAAVNKAPVAANDNYSVNQDTVLTVGTAAQGVLSNDSDENPASLTAKLLTGPANGTLTLNADGTFAYTPTIGFYGTDSFTYAASDGALDSSPATVTITVNHVNHAPVAVDDSATTSQDTAVTIPLSTLLINDTDPDLDVLTVISLSNATSGTASLGASAVKFAPASGFVGNASFTYEVSDGNGGTATATVLVTVTAPATAESTCISVGGVFTLDPNGVWRCQLATVGASGDAAAAALAPFCPSPGGVRILIGQITPTVLVCNDPPVATDDAYSVTDGTSLVMFAPGVLDNDTDPNHDILTAVLVTGPSQGTLSLSANGSFSYTPDSGASGTDTFTYRASDGMVDSNLATVTLTITKTPPPPPPPVNHAPVAQADTATMTSNGIANINVLANDSDPDLDPLTPRVVVQPHVITGIGLNNGGVVTVNADNTLRYDAPPSGIGTVEFTYVANDGSLDSNEVTVTITINSAPGGGGR